MLVKSPARKRVKFCGKGKDHTFVRLPHFMVNSPQFEELPPSATKLLVYIAKLFNGYNNGNISMAWSDMRRRGWSSQGTLNTAKDALLKSGFIICTRHGGKNRCSLYAVTWEPVDAVGPAIEVARQRIASHLWRSIVHSKSGATCSENQSNPLVKAHSSLDHCSENRTSTPEILSVISPKTALLYRYTKRSGRAKLRRIRGVWAHRGPLIFGVVRSVPARRSVRR